MRGRLVLVLLAIVVAQQAWLLAPRVKDWALPPERDAAAAGREVAERLACFSCHGAEGSGGIPNPGGGDGVVPALAGGEMMMWVESEEELREWILYGHPLGADVEERGGYAAGQGTGRLIVMPAFESSLRAGDLDDLVAYLKSISGLQFPDERLVAEGLELAHELGCFRCHGPMGTGGVANPGSLKGYVPGFFGADYDELVESEEELRAWIENGITERFRGSVVARTVIDGQAVKMPAYGDTLDSGDVDALVAVVGWLRDGAWREIPVP